MEMSDQTLADAGAKAAYEAPLLEEILIAEAEGITAGCSAVNQCATSYGNCDSHNPLS